MQFEHLGSDQWILEVIINAAVGLMEKGVEKLVTFVPVLKCI